MSEFVRKWHFFAPWAEAAHEQWLQEQSRQGLHLDSLGSSGFHRFRKGAPEDIVYRWSVLPERERAHYEQLYRDAGWQEAAWVFGYRLWRKPASAGNTEIFTETGSKIRQHWYEIALTAPAVVMLGVVVHNSDFKRGEDQLWLAIFGTFAFLGGYIIARLGTRIWQLKREAK